MPSPTTVVNAALRGGAWARQRVLRDHSSLHGGWYTQNYGNRSYFYLSAACAPSRRFRHPHSVVASKAHLFIEDTFGVAFDSTPTQSLREVVAFEVASGESAIDVERAVRVNANGRIEILWRIPHETTPTGELVIPVVEAFRSFFQLAQAVERGAYRDIYGLRTRARRLDWFAAVSPNVSSDTGWKPWSDIRFPNVRPRVRASQAMPTLSPFGLAHEELQNRRQRTPPAELMHDVLDDLLANSGWDGYDDTIRDAVTELSVVRDLT